MKIQRLAGWLLIVFALAQVFRAISLEATVKYTPGIPFVLLVSTMMTCGAVFLWRGSQSPAKT